MEVNELFKHRSITSCMRASYDTITSDFRSLVKQTWTTHVPFAVLLAIVLYFLLPKCVMQKRILLLYKIRGDIYNGE